MKERRLGIWGHSGVGPNDGYGYAGLKITESMKRHGVSTYWKDTDAPIALCFCQPQNYCENNGQYRIGYTPWESTVLPYWWIPIMQDMDEIWTTSRWCKQIFIENGIDDVEYFPHGLDNSDWTLTHRERTDPFIFFHMGEPADRKNGQVVFDAFKKAFGLIPGDGNPPLLRGRKDVYLVYKTNTWVEARWKDSEGSIIGPVDKYPNVEILKGLLDQKKLDELFNKVHCLVYPSSGEGFGMIPFQAIGTGMPTLMVPWSGVTEFSEYAIPLEFSVKSSNHDYHEGDWAWPDVDDIAEKMVYVYENYELLADRFYDDAIELRKRFDWDEIVEKMLARMEPYW